MVAHAHRIVAAVAHRAHEPLPECHIVVDDEHRSTFAADETLVPGALAHAGTASDLAAGSSTTTVVPFSL